MSKRRFVTLSCAVICSLAHGPALNAQSVIRQGGEFLVNRYTTNSQYQPSVAVDADGDFIVAWSDAAQEPNNGIKGIYAARFNSAGTIQANEFHVNTFFTSIQHEAVVAAENNGDFVIVWQSFGQDGPASQYGVFGQRFNSAGTPLAAEFQVNTYTTSNQRLSYIDTDSNGLASDSDGDFVVVWESISQDGSGYGVFGRRFNSSGTALAVEFMLNSFTALRQANPAVALDSDGDFVVVWESANQDGQVYGVFGKRFNSAGVLQATEFQVNRYTTQSQNLPDVAMEADGDFVVAWQSLHQDGDNLGIFALRFNSAGVVQSVEFQVNVYTVNYQRFPDIAADDSGDFVVTWESRHQDGQYEGVWARRYRANGTAVGGEFQVNSYTFSGQRGITVDWDSDGDFVIAWYNEADQDGSGAGVFAQRFSLPPLATLDVDGNGVVDALTDGLLTLRYLFGFTGATLTGGAIGDNCSRCDATAIINYLAGLGSVLDIDSNGSLAALTDGLLVLRFLFGFTGATLTGGAVDLGGCTTRCDAATILPYLQMLD